MKSLFNLSKKSFSKKNYQYHHDFNPDYLPEKTPLNAVLITFDLSRILLYSMICSAITLKAGTYLLLRKKKHISNPDYLLDPRV